MPATKVVLLSLGYFLEVFKSGFQGQPQEAPGYLAIGQRLGFRNFPRTLLGRLIVPSGCGTLLILFSFRDSPCYPKQPAEKAAHKVPTTEGQWL